MPTPPATYRELFVTVPVLLRLDSILTLPPTFTSRPIPTPPIVTMAPLSVEVELVEVFTNKSCDTSVRPRFEVIPLCVVNTWALPRYTLPATYKSCPIRTSLPIPTPPLTCRAPVNVDIVSVVVLTTKS